MCWNATVSLNTFLFSSFVLALIYYNNTYTQYKIRDFQDHPGLYLFFISFILMQLLEFFLWRNMKHPVWNHIFSRLAAILLVLQPVASLMLIQNKRIRYRMLTLYWIVAFPFTLYRMITKKITAYKSPQGNMVWDFVIKNGNNEWIFFAIWLGFFFFGFVYERIWTLFFFGLITLLLLLTMYWNEHTFGSVWCWFVNAGMLYYSIVLLYSLPIVNELKKRRV